MANTIRPPKGPNLPLGPTEYKQDYTNQLTNVLRLYHNQVDNALSALMDNSGGRYINFPHVSASDTTDQYAPGDDVPVQAVWNTLESTVGFLLGGTGATAEFAGIYRIDYSLQFVNTDNDAHDVFVWLKVAGADVPRSGSKFTIPARKSAGEASYVIAVSFVIFPVQASGIIELFWVTDKAYNPTGPVDGVYMQALPAQTTPYARPASPSAIGAITFVSELSQ